jgi:hypothetical protein
MEQIVLKAKRKAIKEDGLPGSDHLEEAYMDYRPQKVGV